MKKINKKIQIPSIAKNNDTIDLNKKSVNNLEICISCGENKKLLLGGYCKQCDWENANDIYF